jgi:hypothetical protein
METENCKLYKVEGRCKFRSDWGHKSSKTTEIYTHITTKGFDKITMSVG